MPHPGGFKRVRLKGFPPTTFFGNSFRQFIITPPATRLLWKSGWTIATPPPAIMHVAIIHLFASLPAGSNAAPLPPAMPRHRRPCRPITHHRLPRRHQLQLARLDPRPCQASRRRTVDLASFLPPSRQSITRRRRCFFCEGRAWSAAGPSPQHDLLPVCLSNPPARALAIHPSR